MKYLKFNEEVLFAIDPVVKISSEDINQLKQVANEVPRKRSRLCAHKDISSSLHEMVIIHKSDTYIRPHKHVGKSESFHLIDGEVVLVLFEDYGDLREVVQMGDYRSGKIFYYRIDEPIFHSILIKSDFVVFHESTEGPFIRKDTIYADWSPEEGDVDGIYQFQKKLNQQIAEL
ncbi:MAG: WbuC family cupin fold metalloprotein [Methanoregula sp.]|nr:WbuC family cupin fold metalloprotein [Methanoregula sp.]